MLIHFEGARLFTSSLWTAQILSIRESVSVWTRIFIICRQLPAGGHYSIFHSSPPCLTTNLRVTLNITVTFNPFLSPTMVSQSSLMIYLLLSMLTLPRYISAGDFSQILTLARIYSPLLAEIFTIARRYSPLLADTHHCSQILTIARRY